jgi:hypothetical protein
MFKQADVYRNAVNNNKVVNGTPIGYYVNPNGQITMKKLGDNLTTDKSSVYVAFGDKHLGQI